MSSWKGRIVAVVDYCIKTPADLRTPFLMLKATLPSSVSWKSSVRPLWKVSCMISGIYVSALTEFLSLLSFSLKFLSKSRSKSLQTPNKIIQSFQYAVSGSDAGLFSRVYKSIMVCSEYTSSGFDPLLYLWPLDQEEAAGLFTALKPIGPRGHGRVQSHYTLLYVCVCSL